MGRSVGSLVDGVWLGVHPKDGEQDGEDSLVHDVRRDLDPVGGAWQWLPRDHSRVGDVLILLRVDLGVTHLVL
jgi:hypothetical protein